MARHSLGSASSPTDLAADRPGATPYLSGDPSLSELPVDENGDRQALFYMSDGTGTGSDGDLCIAVPNGAGGVSVAIAASVSATLTVGL